MNQNTHTPDDYCSEQYKTLSYIHLAVVIYFICVLTLSQFQMRLFPYMGSLPHLEVPGGYFSQAVILLVVSFLLVVKAKLFTSFNKGHRTLPLVLACFVFVLVVSIMWGMMSTNLSFVSWAVLFLSTFTITYIGVKVKMHPPHVIVHPPVKLNINLPEPARVKERTPAAKVEVEEDDPIRHLAIYTEKDFSQIVGMNATKDRLLVAGNDILNSFNNKGTSKRNGILLFGDPGNGKTHFAECLAGELGLPLISISYGDVASKWLNQTTESVSKVFKDAYAQAPCVLFFDEIDSLIRSRDGQSVHDDSRKTTNTILTEIGKLRNRGIILIGATNYLESLDTAAIREGRFDMKIEVPPPDEEARYAILLNSICVNNPGLDYSDDSVRRMAKRWVGFSVKRIQAVGEELTVMDEESDVFYVDSDSLGRALRRIQGRKGKLPEGTKSIKQLFFDDSLKSQLTGIAKRMNDAEKTEELGGSVPSGILFFGPSGTGKTETARALAKETNYAFISYTGNGLISEPDSIKRMMKEAKDIRPCIVFIDEADDILANRSYSNVKSITNELLIAMDGSDEKVKDIVFIAATNDPDSIDSAALRGGRFTEKLFFDYPSQKTLARFVESWIQGSSAKFGEALTPTLIAGSIGEEVSIGNAAAILQEAVNQMIVRCSETEKYEVSEVDIDVAKEIIFGRN